MNDYVFGNFLYKLRTEKGLTQSELGNMLGVTNKAVSKWENGASKPSTRLLSHLSEILGVSVEELLSGAHIEKPESRQNLKDEIIKRSRSLAIKAAAAFSAVFTVLLLLIDIIIIINGFELPDDVMGPLCSMVFIVLFIVSVTCSVVFNIEYKKSNYFPGEAISDNVYGTVRKLIYIPLIILSGIAITAFPLYYTVLLFAPSSESLTFTSLLYWVIILTAVILCLSVIIFALRLKLYNKTHKKRNIPENVNKSVPFSALPLYAKICFIGILVLVPPVVYCGIQYIFMPWRVIYFCLVFAEFAMISVVCAAQYKIRKQRESDKTEYDN